jgi:hypothetical protein
MDLYDKINLLQNRQNQLSNEANLEQLKANEAELKKLRLQLKQEAEKKAKQPKCPHCGGGCEQGFDRCKNCSQEVIWCGHLVGKPGTMNELQQKLEQYKVAKLEKAERDETNKRNQRIQKQKQLERQRTEAATLIKQKRVTYFLIVPVSIFVIIYGIPFMLRLCGCIPWDG